MRSFLWKNRWLFLLGTLAGWALRGYFLRQYPAVQGDSLIYGEIAKNLLQHNVFGMEECGEIVPTLIRLPGYPAFLAAIFSIFGMEHYTAVLRTQLFIDLATCFLIAETARRAISERAAKIAFPLAALCPFTANYCAAPLTETLSIFAAAAALLLLAVVGWRVNRNPRTNDYQGEFAEEIVEAHMASLNPGNISGLASNDAQAVKGWFEGKARFAVPVHDFSHQGFELQGARVDLVEGRTIPALVYRHDGHLIDVFIWPTRERDTAQREGSRQGFQWVDWRKRKMEFCAVSDIDPADLKKLYELMDSSAS